MSCAVYVFGKKPWGIDFLCQNICWGSNWNDLGLPIIFYTDKKSCIADCGGFSWNAKKKMQILLLWLTPSDRQQHYLEMEVTNNVMLMYIPN